MEPDYPAGKSPRRELQGPRPAPLKVRKDSHKIRKPPQPPQHRPPVIIYTVSPKVIHTDPSEFMTLVQRLTGSSNISSNYTDSTELASPAARFAAVEKTKSSKHKNMQQGSSDDVAMVDQEMVCRSFPGVLSPGPGAFPPIPANFFSPQSDPNPLNFFHDLSPAMQGNKSYLENSFLPSPSHFLSPHVSPTTPALDLFNNFFDM